MTATPRTLIDPGFLRHVEARLAGILRASEGVGLAGLSDTRAIDDAARWLVTAPGAKRARPLLTRLLAGVVGLDLTAAVDIAAAAELIHSASLLHDDVVDHGAERRGIQTANARWDDGVAVLAGDLALAAALGSLEGQPRAVTARAVETVVAMARAALVEVRHRRRVGTLATWEAIAAGKTGALFAWCGEAVGLAADDTVAGRHFAEFGRQLGLGFQLVDDLKDFAAHLHGKDRWADLRNGNPSWPIWRAAERSADVRAALERLWQDPGPPAEARVSALASAIADTGALADASRAAEAALERAFEQLGPWADRPAFEPVRAFVAGIEASVGAPTPPPAATAAPQETSAA